jgi:hypothetical protein
VDGFVVGEFGEEGVDFVGADAGGVGGFFGAGEDAEDEDFHVGLFGAEFVGDGLDAGDGVGRGVVAVAGVVGADHEDGEFGFEAVIVAVFQAPEDVLGAVAADAEVGGFVGGPGFVPKFFGAFPALGDGVAKEDELSFAFFGDFVEGFVPLLGAVMRGGDDGEVEFGVLGGGHVLEAKQGEEEQFFHGWSWF